MLVILNVIGVETPQKFADMDVTTFVAYHASWWKLFTSQTHKERLEEAVLKMKKQIELLSWLESKSLEHLYLQFVSHGIVSKENVLQKLDRETFLSIMGNEDTYTNKVFHLLRSEENSLNKLSNTDQRYVILAPLFVGVRVIWWLIVFVGKNYNIIFSQKSWFFNVKVIAYRIQNRG